MSNRLDDNRPKKMEIVCYISCVKTTQPPGVDQPKYLYLKYKKSQNCAVIAIELEL